MVNGARVDSETTLGRTPAMVAVSEGHRRALRVLLEANCDVSRLNLLTTKPNKKFATIVEMLLLAGAPVDVQVSLRGFFSRYKIYYALCTTVCTGSAVFSAPH